MKLATVFILVGVALAAAVWLLSGSGAPSAIIDRNLIVSRFPHGAKNHATALGGEPGNLTLSPTAKGPPVRTTAAPDRSGTAALLGEPALGGESRPAVGKLPQIARPVTDLVTGLPGRDAGPAATTRRSESLLQPLLPPTPVGASSVSPPLAVPAGARLPALFLDERPLPPPQRRILDRAANEFIDAVAGDPSAQDRVLWETARDAADQQYIKLYGHAAYNALHLRAAREAVREQRVTATPTPP